MTYDSLKKAAMFAVFLTLGTTALWFVVVPVAQSWLKVWLVQPPVEIPLWKVLLISFARSWPKVWPAFVVFVWVTSFLPIELVRRFKARRT